MTQPTLHDIVQDTCALLRHLAPGMHSKIEVSPEVAALLERVQPRAGIVSVASTAEAIELLSSPSPLPEREARAPMPDSSSADRPGTLAALSKEISFCGRCGLCNTRTQTVFGVGNPHADLVFIGEAPGEEEDRHGEPFVGKAGQLLTDIIEKGMQLRRDEVYICNVLKCRPPGNRDPHPDEVQQCEPFLAQQLEVIQPKVICALGKFAAHTLLNSTESMWKLRGHWHWYRGIPVRVTYHPSYLLRSPQEKRKTWEDVQEIMKLLRGDIVLRNHG